jgi:Asp-tRNA(Asn)/Glu-tRNA(Gln) amidotransferase B subunit
MGPKAVPLTSWTEYCRTYEQAVHCVQRFYKCEGENGALRCDQFLSPSSVERCMHKLEHDNFKSAVNTRNLEANIDDYQSTISMEV